MTTETKSAASSTIHIPQIQEKFMHMILGTQDHWSSLRQKCIDYPLLLMLLCFSSFIHHVDPFQLQPTNCLMYVSFIQTPYQHWWFIMISALDWNCGSKRLTNVNCFIINKKSIFQMLSYNVVALSFDGTEG